MIETGQMKNNMEKTIEQLERELQQMKKDHIDMWNIYGSELSTGDMVAKEEALENKIMQMKTTQKWSKCGNREGFEDPSQIIDD